MKKEMIEKIGKREKELIERIFLNGGEVRMYSKDGKLFPYKDAEKYQLTLLKRITRLVSKGYVEIVQEINPQTKRQVKIIKLTEKALLLLDKSK